MAGSASDLDVSWPVRWLAWPDFRLPTDPVDAAEAFREAHRRSEFERVEIGCRGGVGRTGTALACIAVLDGVAPDDAVRYIRERYDVRAVETPRQRRYVRQFQA
jgi:protein-tyrosine phosphatase